MLDRWPLRIPHLHPAQNSLGIRHYGPPPGPLVGCHMCLVVSHRAIAISTIAKPRCGKLTKSLSVESSKPLRFENPGSRDRKRFRREMHGTILSGTRRAGASRFSDVYNVTYGLNRGLAIASALACMLAAYDQKWLPSGILFLVFASTTFRAARANLRFERDMLRTFATLS